MKQFMINESVSVNDVKSQPYFERFPETLLYRGVRRNYDEIQEMPFKFRTKPLDSAVFIHNAINVESERVLGVPIRNLIFTYTVQDDADKYGNVVIIVPKGNDFRIFYNPWVYDLTSYASLEPDILYERMWESISADFSSLDKANDIAGDLWELAESIEMSINAVSFNSYDILSELEKHLTAKLPRYIQLLAKKHHISNERLDEIQDAVVSENIVGEILTIFKDLMENFINDIVEEYIQGVEEVDEEDDLDLSFNPEMMIYAPDGFYVVPEEYFDDIL